MVRLRLKGEPRKGRRQTLIVADVTPVNAASSCANLDPTQPTLRLAVMLPGATTRARARPERMKMFESPRNTKVSIDGFDSLPELSCIRDVWWL